jgi:hypothetical protein
VHTAYRELELERSSQWKRRGVARSVFSFVEAATECIKVEIRAAVRRDGLPLSDKELETLGTLKLVDKRPTKFLPLDQDVKRSFALASKVWGLDFRLTTDGEPFRSFIAAKSHRDRLAHPRTYYDIQVADLNMSHYSVAYIWFKREFARLFRTRVSALSEGPLA